MEPIETIYHNLVTNLRCFFQERGFRKAVIGLSGGVDSSLTLKIAADGLRAENITAVIMPELGLTADENMQHAKKLAEFFGMKYYYQPINAFITDFNTLPWKQNPVAQINTKARVRTIILYNFANAENALVLGTSNKSEIMLGYGTKYGDLAADVEVIGVLFKTQVYELARYIGIPDQIIKKIPTAELAQGQTDEQELGASYGDLDRILEQTDLGMDKIIEKGYPKVLVKKVFQRVALNRHKTENTPVISLESKVEAAHIV